MATNIITQNQGALLRIQSYLGELFVPEPKEQKDSSYGLIESNFLDSIFPHFKNPFADFNFKEVTFGLVGLGLVGAFFLRNTPSGRLGLLSFLLFAGCRAGKDEDDTSSDTPAGIPPGSTSLTSANAILIGEDYDGAGSSVAGVGDVNKDGYSDILIGAPNADDGYGIAYLMNGPVSGTISLSDADSKLTAEKAHVGLSYDRVGSSVAGAGDMNRDGYDDLLVVANATENEHEAGYLVYGPISGDMSLSRADSKLTGYVQNIASAGDVNGDDDLDIIIGAQIAEVVYVVEGPISGTMSLSEAEATINAEADGDYAGQSVSGAGDVNSDGNDDLVIGAPGADKAYVLNGPVSGDISLSDADAKLIGEVYAVSGAGDVDGDGYPDILIGGSGDENGGGYLVNSPVSGDISLSDAHTHFVGEAPYDQAGVSVSGAGDVNYDSYADFLIGAPALENDSGGAAYLILGPVESGSISLSEVYARFIGDSELLDNAGDSVSGAGDVNRDGYDDILIGSPYYSKLGDVDDADESGAAYLILGGI